MAEWPAGGRIIRAPRNGLSWCLCAQEPDSMAREASRFVQLCIVCVVERVEIQPHQISSLTLILTKRLVYRVKICKLDASTCHCLLRLSPDGPFVWRSAWADGDRIRQSALVVLSSVGQKP
jgi:hypothetical protein